MDRLNDYDAVTLNLPKDHRRIGVSELECVVVSLGPSGVSLEPIGRIPPRLPARISHVLLAFQHGGMLVGLKGALTYGDPGLHFAVEDGVQMRRTRCSRVEVAIPLHVRRASTGEAAEGQVRNLSASGALVALELPVSVDELLDVSFALPGDAGEISTRGRVTRLAGQVAGIEFGAHSHLVEQFVAAQRSRSMRELAGGARTA